MHSIAILIQRRPLITFFVLANAITWVLVPLVSISLGHLIGNGHRLQGGLV
jgi:hypothetical protein